MTAETMIKRDIRVLLVEDHPVVREHMRRKLVKMRGIALIDEAENGADAVDLALRKNFDVMLLDISLPDKSGLEILTILKSKKPSLPVLMFSMYPEIPYALQTLKTGASGYLYKETALEHLMEAIQRVSEGSVYVSQHLAHYLESVFVTDPARTLREVFSEKEICVLQSLARGGEVVQIAAEMNLEENVVNHMRLRIFELTKVSCAADLSDYLAHTTQVN
ncbi:MAG: response regulator transcription factor [Gammaproteobacteria bacterium]|nr:response regulator transcription factor [Gammaproteobacteria bacterium]